MSKQALAKMTDAQLVRIVGQINDVLWARHKPDEYDIEGLETLTSAVDELSDEL